VSKNNSEANQAEFWRFDGPLRLLKQRAFLLSSIRDFFRTRHVLEVETPVLSSAGNTDVHIEMFSSQSIKANSKKAYLRTSPEFFHKRLLASGAGDLFEIARVFRQGERSRLHNPEFTLLEWYRLDFKLFDLMDEVTALIQFVRAGLGQSELKVETISYQVLFENWAGFNPFEISLSAIQERCKTHGYTGSELSRTEALDFVFSVVIQPRLESSRTDNSKTSAGVNQKTASGLMVYHFPVEMAALAQVHPEKPDRCLRFEFLWHGVELANGYQELTNATEQLQRFEHDNHMRLKLGKPALPIDNHLIDSLTHGLPECSGVALGVERLMMCLLGQQSIDKVMGFVAENS